MKIVRQEADGRQYMVRPNFELTHFYDTNLTYVEEHHHNCYEIYFINSGVNVSYMIEGKLYSPRPGDVMVINKFDMHRPIFAENSIYERIVLWIEPDFLESLCTEGPDLCLCFKEALKNNKNLLRMEQNMMNSVRAALGKFEKAYFGQNFGDDILLKCYLCEILVLLNRAFLNIKDEEIENNITENKIVNQVLEHINNNIAGDLSLEFLSEKFYVSKYHLIREFKKTVGYTVYNYILSKRLLAAEKLLLENMPASEVYLRCGFNDYSSFMRAFTKHYGVTPRQLAKKAVHYNSHGQSS